MVRNKERIQRPVTHFVKVQIVLLLGIRMLSQHIDLCKWSSNHIINYSAVLAYFLDVIELANLHDIVLVFLSARHAAAHHLEAGRVGYDRLLEADLRAVSEAGDHCRILFPLLGESLLGGRIAIRILQAFNVPDYAWREAETFDPSIKIHLNAGLVTIARGKDHTVLSGIGLHDGSDG